MQLLATGMVLLSFLYWLAQLVSLLRSRGVVPRVSAIEQVALPSWPTVSAIIPARNEAAQLQGALEAKLAEGYPALELVVVNDRSTDNTGAIAEELAARDPRIRVVHVDSLPEGWLGKVHALHRGLDRATGEWILFSDADVHIAPETLSRLISWAERSPYDHVAVLPSAHSRSALVDVALAVFFRLMACMVPLWKVSDPSSKVALGCGAFNLFRRRVLDASPGLPWLKMEIGDDVALGVMLKRAGARQAVVIGEDRVSLEFYPDFSAVARGLEKNGAGAPLPHVLVLMLTLLGLEMGFLAALGTGDPLLTGLAATTALLAAYTQLRAGHWLRFPTWPALVPFLGTILLALVMVRSAALALLRGGVVWRGTFYSTKTVRAGARMGMYGRS